MNIRQYWSDVLRQDADAMRRYFAPEAFIIWHNTNELFTLEEFIRANCEYPGDWDGDIEQLVCAEDMVITATHVFTQDRKSHFHVVSFFRIVEDKIISVDEYWGDDGPAPQWRQELRIGTRLK